MIPYQERIADLYDLFYGSKDYDAEVRFLERTFNESSVPVNALVLDLACGTGGHSSRLCTLGYEVCAVDRSEAMLRVAARKPSGVRRPMLVAGDMRSIPLRTGVFDAAVCLFDAIGYAVTTEGIQSAVDELSRVLKPGGTLVIEFWHAPAMLGNYEPVRIRRWERPEGEVIRISETSLSKAESVAHVEYSVLDLRSDGRLFRTSETHVNRFFQVDEMDAFLERAGFADVSWNPGFEHGEVDDSTWHVVAVTRRW